MKKKLIIIHRDLYHPYTGGLYRLAQIIRYLQNRGIEMDVINCADFPVWIRKNRLYFILKIVKILLRYRKNSFIFVNHGMHFRLIIPLFISRMLGNRYGINCLQTFYNLRKGSIERNLEFLIEYLILQGASLLIFPSVSAKAYFSPFHLNSKTQKIVNPAPKVWGKPRKHSAENAKNLLFVGQVKPWKGLDTLIKALSRLKNLDFTLNVIGRYDSNSKYFHCIQKLIYEANLSGKIIFHGEVDKERLSHFYRKADIFISASRSETFGMVLLEAISFGLPIIASAIPATRESLKDNINAILYEPENIDALAEAIHRLITDHNLRISIAKNNALRSAKIRTWRNVADDTLAAIKKFL